MPARPWAESRRESRPCGMQGFSPIPCIQRGRNQGRDLRKQIPTRAKTPEGSLRSRLWSSAGFDAVEEPRFVSERRSSAGFDGVEEVADRAEVALGLLEDRGVRAVC